MAELGAVGAPSQALDAGSGHQAPYAVKRGDSLWKIGRRAGLPNNEILTFIEEVKRLNPSIRDRVNSLVPATEDGRGDRLILPEPVASALRRPAAASNGAREQSETPALGQRHPRVPGLKQALIALGYKNADLDPTDDRFDSHLQRAIYWFQAEFHEYDGPVDGIPGERFRAALHRATLRLDLVERKFSENPKPTAPTSGLKEPEARRTLEGAPIQPDAARTRVDGDEANPAPITAGSAQTTAIEYEIDSTVPIRVFDSLVRSIRAGHTGEDVRQMQRLLNRLGHSLQVDGRFGPATRDAVIEFQRDLQRNNSSFKVDGIVGPATWPLLVEAASSPDTEGRTQLNVDPSSLSSIADRGAYDILVHLAYDDPHRYQGLISRLRENDPSLPQNSITLPLLRGFASQAASLGFEFNESNFAGLRSLGPGYPDRIGYHAALAIEYLFRSPPNRAPTPHDAAIQQWAEHWGMPYEVARAVAWTESRFDADIQSHAGAVGLFQFMPETAREQGDRAGIGNFDRTDPVASARAGTHYLVELYRAFGNWPDALAAYNGGQGRLRSRGSVIRMPIETIDYVGRNFVSFVAFGGNPEQWLASPPH